MNALLNLHRSAHIVLTSGTVYVLVIDNPFSLFAVCSSAAVGRRQTSMMFTHLITWSRRWRPAASYLVCCAALFTRHIGLYTVCLQMPDCNMRAALLRRSSEEVLTVPSWHRPPRGLYLSLCISPSPVLARPNKFVYLLRYPVTYACLLQQPRPYRLVEVVDLQRPL